MTTHIYFDGLFLTGHLRNTGKGRYLNNLLIQIEKLTRDTSKFTTVILLPPGLSGGAFGLDIRDGFDVLSTRVMNFRRAWRRGLSTAYARAKGLGILFVPESVPILAKPKKLVVNLHDVSVNLFPRQFRTIHGRAERFASWSNMRRADLIFTDSEHSRTDMISGFGVPADRIVVTHLGVDPTSFKPGGLSVAERQVLSSRYGVKREYVLYVGAIEERKNLMRLVRSFYTLCVRFKGFPYQLVLAGRPGVGYEEISSLCAEGGNSGSVVLTGGVPECDLITLYQGAACLVLPSFYEGFGLPLVEAMACGTPVLTSNRSCLPEIGGEAALYFDPESDEEICAALERLLSDSTLRQDMSRRGVARASNFTWESCAKLTLEALDRL